MAKAKMQKEAMAKANTKNGNGKPTAAEVATANDGKVKITADEKLVNAIKAEVRKAYKPIHKAIIAIGIKLIDMLQMEMDSSGKWKKDTIGYASLNKAIADLINEPGMPTRAWFFNAMNLAKQELSIQRRIDSSKNVAEHAKLQKIATGLNNMSQNSRITLDKLKRKGAEGQKEADAICIANVEGKLTASDIKSRVDKAIGQEVDLYMKTDKELASMDKNQLSIEKRRNDTRLSNIKDQITALTNEFDLYADYGKDIDKAMAKAGFKSDTDKITNIRRAKVAEELAKRKKAA